MFIMVLWYIHFQLQAGYYNCLASSIVVSILQHMMMKEERLVRILQ